MDIELAYSIDRFARIVRNGSWFVTEIKSGRTGRYVEYTKSRKEKEEFATFLRICNTR